MWVLELWVKGIYFQEFSGSRAGFRSWETCKNSLVIKTAWLVVGQGWSAFHCLGYFQETESSLSSSRYGS